MADSKRLKILAKIAGKLTDLKDVIHHRTVRPQAKPQPAVPARGFSRLRREVVPLLCSPG